MVQVFESVLLMVLIRLLWLERQWVGPVIGMRVHWMSGISFGNVDKLLSEIKNDKWISPTLTKVGADYFCFSCNFKMFGSQMTTLSLEMAAVVV